MKETLSNVIRNRLQEILEHPVNKEDTDEMFDRLYFYHVILVGYEKQMKGILGSGTFETFVKNYEQRLNEQLLYLRHQRRKMHMSVFARSQILFNYLGLCYLSKIAGWNQEADLNFEELDFLNQVLGYSYIYDYMVTFWGKKLELSIGGIAPQPKNEEEACYLATHFFLTESEYLTRETTNENVAELLKYVPYALENQQLDLMAELLWAFSYFGWDRQETRELYHRLQAETTSTWGSNPRRQLHYRYSYVCALLAVHKRMEDADSQFGNQLSDRSDCRSAS